MEDESFIPLIRIERCFLCPCGAGACRLFTSHTKANPNRHFYKCPEPRQCRYGKDGFFKWADQVRPDEMIDVPFHSCGGCGAGPCRVRRENGRLLFMCTLKEGQGSCGYRVFEDELEMSLRNKANSGVTSPVEEDVVGEKLEVTRPRPPVSLADSNGTASPDIWLVGEEIAGEKLEVTSPPVSSADCNATAYAKIGLGGEHVIGEKLEATSAKTVPVGEDVTCEKLVATPSSVDCNATASVKILLGGENAASDKWQSPTISTSLRPKVRRTVSRKMKQSRFQEDDDSKPLRSPLKRLRNGDKVPAFSISARPHVLDMKSMMVKQQWWMMVAIHKNLEPQLQGWWGRLAFHALPKSMIPAASELYIYGLIPLLLDRRLVMHEEKLIESDASTNLLMSLPVSKSAHLPDSLVVQNDKPVNVGASSAINTNKTPPVAYSLNKSLHDPGCNGVVEPGDKPSAPHDVPSCATPIEKTRMNNRISKSVSKVFEQAASELQNDLFTFLENVDINDHQSMVLEAEDTFTALDRLGIDHQHFDKRVREFISHSMTLAAVEQSMPKTDNYPQMELCYKFEKMKLDEMESAHTKSVDTLMRIKNSLSVLQELIGSAKEWLFQLEAEYVCCELEFKSMDRQLEKNSKEKQALEGKYLIASKELEECMKLHEQREAAKAAFDRAKASLRG